jgi:hypothetical protein
MAIEDYLPNIFASSAPSYLQGLLGAEETQKLQGRANVQGLLGAGLALAQGMSRVGPRRSAAENILGALAGGFGAAGGAYDQGVKNYVTQQQIAQTQLAQQDALLKRQQMMAQQGAIEQLLRSPEIANDPLKVAYIRANPNEALKILSEQLPLQQAISGGQVQSAPQTAPQVAANVPAGQERAMPEVTVTATPGPDAMLQQDKNRLIDENRRIAGLTSEQAQKRRKENLDQIAAIDKQLDRFAASGYNFAAVEELVPQQFKARVRNLQQAAETGSLTMDQLTQRIADIEKQAIDFVTKKTDYTNESRRVAAGMFGGKSIEELEPIELMRLQNAMDQMEIQKRRAGATTINLPSESERTAGFLTNRIVGSLDQLKAVTGAAPSAASPNFKAETIKYFTGSDYLKNLANPETRQQVEAAQLEILDAALTLGTGAAYTKEQLLNYQKSYFPQLGDKPATVKDKAQRLSSLLDSAMIKSGRAAPKGSTPIFSPADLQNAVDAELERRKGKK